MSIDVMIGNWIDTPRGIEKVYKIEEDAINGVAWPYCKPIPLTPEILEKCGIVEVYDGAVDFPKGIAYVFYKNAYGFHLYKRVVSNEYRWDMGSTSVRIDYLHQLQNLYYALTQNELTITL